MNGQQGSIKRVATLETKYKEFSRSVKSAIESDAVKRIPPNTAIRLRRKMDFLIKNVNKLNHELDQIIPATSTKTSGAAVTPKGLYERKVPTQ
jgi:hypothetical protein